MSITGIEKLEFGVDDLNHSAKFMHDFGLAGDASGRVFTTLSGARVELNPIGSPDLPPAFEAGNTLRRMTWGVADQAALEALRPKLERQPGFRRVDGALECLDPNGMTLRVQVSQQTAVELNVEPINQWGDVRRIDTPSPVYDRAQPINVGHVVFFVEELAAVESFYREVLGFQ
ncbi:MAG: glyoxalase, partial [Klebsiella sp.]|nr:glyoxalase [Klebsiella sp.]